MFVTAEERGLGCVFYWTGMAVLCEAMSPGAHVHQWAGQLHFHLKKSFCAPNPGCSLQLKP